LSLIAESQWCRTDQAANGTQPPLDNKYIPDVRYVAISDARPMGHISGAGISARENEMQNDEIGRFLGIVTERGRKLQ
jgi:hypothetical protein